MAKLTWDQTGEHLYETGVDRGVVYPYDADASDKAKAYGPGVAWNGLTGVQESPSGADSNPLYADNIKYLDLRSAEDFGLTITAYTYPDEFAVLDGTAELTPGVRVTQQTRKLFGLAYRSLVGSDTKGTDHGYKLHLVYGCTASPSEVDRETVNEDPDAAEFSWEITTTPVEVSGLKPTSHIIIDSTKVDAAKLAALEKALYGGDEEGEKPYLPLPDDVKTLLTA